MDFANGTDVTRHIVGTIANSAIFQTRTQLKPLTSHDERLHQSSLPISRDGIQMMSIMTKFHIRDNFTMSTQRRHTFRGDRIPDIHTFIRA